MFLIFDTGVRFYAYRRSLLGAEGIMLVSEFQDRTVNEYDTSPSSTDFPRGKMDTALIRVSCVSKKVYV